MRNNKGYTLTELLLAMVILVFVMLEVVNLMRNTSVFYNKSRNEIELQTEAQQLIQQFEELAIDCDSSIVQTGNVITVTNNSPRDSYRFELTGNEVYLTVGAGAPQLMATDVKSMALDLTTTDFAHTSRVMFNVEMENGIYTYNASKDIYLRNDLGSAMVESTPTVEVIYTDALDVLRFKEYDLDTEFGAANYSWDPAHNGSALYSLSSDKLSCSYVLNTRIPGTGSNYYIIKGDNGKTIKITTLDLAFGYDYSDHGMYGKYGVAFMSYDVDKENDLKTVIAVAGISIADCEEFTVTPMYQFNPGLITIGGTSYPYYKIICNSAIITPKCDKFKKPEGSSVTKTYYQDEYAFNTGKFCYELIAPEGSGYTEVDGVKKAKSTVSIPSMEVRIYLAGSTDPTNPDADTAEPTNINNDGGSPDYVITVNSKNPTFEIQEDINSIVCHSSRITGGNMGRGQGIGEFYRDNGELFYDIRAVYKGGYVMDCKVVIKPVGSNGSFKLESFPNAAEHMGNAGETGMAMGTIEHGSLAVTDTTGDTEWGTTCTCTTDCTPDGDGKGDSSCPVCSVSASYCHPETAPAPGEGGEGGGTTTGGGESGGTTTGGGEGGGTTTPTPTPGPSTE